MPRTKKSDQTTREIKAIIVVQLPREQAYTDSEILETLKVKSVYKEIKVQRIEPEG